MIEILSKKIYYFDKILVFVVHLFIVRNIINLEISIIVLSICLK